MLNTEGSAGCSGAILMVVGRLSEVGSRMSCVSLVWFGNCRMSFLGENWEIVLSRSGSILVLVSCVAIHLVRRWTMSSVGLGWSGLMTLQRRQKES